MLGLHGVALIKWIVRARFEGKGNKVKRRLKGGLTIKIFNTRI